MFWQQVWTHGAAVVRDRLSLADSTAVCTAVENYLRTGQGTVRRVTPNGGTLIAGGFNIDFMLEHNARYESADGEELTGNVCWVVDVYWRKP